MVSGSPDPLIKLIPQIKKVELCARYDDYVVASETWDGVLSITKAERLIKDYVIGVKAGPRCVDRIIDFQTNGYDLKMYLHCHNQQILLSDCIINLVFDHELYMIGELVSPLSFIDEEPSSVNRFLKFYNEFLEN